ncbi:MAG: polysaccharide deacetylase family protein [Gammaproteobacteria bacterium]|nr:polysaccharide deacetylase family protein [Pseudomonadales bacterium]MCP5348066.1 polysaccharide deacetylase family protein [Pseudomonadales bacterium]
MRKSASRAPLRAVVSIHDVMPETLPHTTEILNRLLMAGVGPVTGLVIPGKRWSEHQLDWLRDLEHAGLVIAGHGWRHRVEKRVSLSHKLHGLFLSRMVAEHLSLCEAEIASLVRRCFDWFIEHGFQSPCVYVPPAWALGRIQRTTLDSLPFRLYENLSGVYRSGIGDFVSLPLTGYEADNWPRLPFLCAWNRYSEMCARLTARPLRISIHPRDFSLGLARQIESQLQRVDEFLGYPQIFAVNRP